jgi:hypothetical protein
MSTNQSLARLGSVTAVAGAAVLFASTLLHPMSRDPNNAPEAFAEYAADSFYVWTHLGQFAGFALLGAALVALAATFEPGRAAAWARIGLAGTVAGVAVAAALQAATTRPCCGAERAAIISRGSKNRLRFSRPSSRGRNRSRRIRHQGLYLGGRRPRVRALGRRPCRKHGTSPA